MMDPVASGWNAFRQRLLELWLSRGGGYYGLVAALTFLYLEFTGLAGDLSGLGQFSFSLGWLISFLVQGAVDAGLNALFSAIWPLKWIGLVGVGPKLFALLAGSYVLYRASRPAVLRLLGADQHQAAIAAAGRSRHIPPSS